MPPTRTVISGAVSVSSCAAIDQQLLCRHGVLGLEVVAEPVGTGSSTANDSTSVCSCDASVRPGVKGTVTSWPAFFAACSTPAQPPRTIRSASETFFPPDCALLNSFWIPSRVCSTVLQLRRLVDLPVLLRRETDARPVRPAALVGAAERGRRRPGGRDQLGDRQARSEDLALEGGDVLRVDQLVVDRGHRVLPDQLLRRDLRAEIARARGPCRGGSA